ncbi:hypothetical protein [Nocardiopsis alborubida]|uniref:Uncharacterized protein n=1 Tax=Nocardiopsis alborubida TaxID=146802 RepID=A0A7X6M9M2_9ACTN|nr:hypothetical protein [Nocardiopsis alborubida]NKY96707.1 hypothetical protein [Nocardiopsis alborubida]
MVMLRSRLPRRPAPTMEFDVWARSQPTASRPRPAGPCGAYLERRIQQAGGTDVVAAAEQRAHSHPRPTEEAHYQHWAPLTHRVRTWLAQQPHRTSPQTDPEHSMPTPLPTTGVLADASTMSRRSI